MRFPGLPYLAVFLLLALPALCPAAGAVPGELASDAQPPVAVPAAYSPLRPRIEVVQVHDRPADTVQRIWIGSVCAALAASAADAASSWGKQESNPLLASPDGTFGARGLAIKAGIAGALLLPQWLLRRHKQLRTGFIAGNFADAAVFSAAAIHNAGISSR